MILNDSACGNHPVHPNVPWVPSPAPQHHDEFDPYEAHMLNVDNQQLHGPVVPVPWVEATNYGGGGGITWSRRSGSQNNGSIPSDPFSVKRKRGFSLKKFLRFFGTRRSQCCEKENWILPHNYVSRHHEPIQKQTGPPDLPMSAWKEYGYWARPMIDGVEVRNNISPAPDHVLQSVDTEEVFKSLRGPRGSPHPENWVAGLQHPSLPPKPSFWKTPNPHEPVPPPWECRLNPFLEHRRNGQPLVYFDTRLDEQSITFMTFDSWSIPLMSSNLNQPATYPFVTEMWITSVADDPYPVFPWPVAVYNKRGVLCRDVFHAIFQNFQRFLTKQEVGKFTRLKAALVEEAFNQRREGGLMGRVWDDQDGLRRIDYFADKVMFRGLEASMHRGGSWILFLGPPGPEDKDDDDDGDEMAYALPAPRIAVQYQS